MGKMKKITKKKVFYLKKFMEKIPFFRFNNVKIK